MPASTDQRGENELTNHVHMPNCFAMNKELTGPSNPADFKPNRFKSMEIALFMLSLEGDMLVQINSGTQEDDRAKLKQSQHAFTLAC